MTTPAAPTPPPSPRAPAMHLPTISQILLWGVRGKRNANTAPDDKQEGSDTVCAESSSAAIKKPVKSTTYCIECSSGTEFKTHARIVDAQPECRKSDVIVHQDVFECLDGVDTRLLLRLARKRVFEKVELLGGNAIIDERCVSSRGCEPPPARDVHTQLRA
jgi:hypothetical protein